MSQWNALSGNWSFEERDYSAWAEERLQALLGEERAGVRMEGRATVADLSATVIYARGRKRPGCLAERIKFRAAIHEQEYDVTVEEVQTPGEFELRVADADAAAEKKVAEFVAAVLAALHAELSEKV